MEYAYYFASWIGIVLQGDERDIQQHTALCSK